MAKKNKNFEIDSTFNSDESKVFEDLDSAKEDSENESDIAPLNLKEVIDEKKKESLNGTFRFNQKNKK